MINKSLEKKLKDGGFKDIITWLEKCERGKIKVLEIRVDKTAGITGKKTLDRTIIEYLKELNIKVLYSEYSSKEQDESEIKQKQQKKQCKHFAHNIYNKKLSHEDNVNNFLDKEVVIFKVDKNSNESFAICPECTSMITIS